MTQEPVARHLGIPRSAVSDIEAGKREVTATELLALSRLFGEPMERLLGLGVEDAGKELLMFRAAAVTSPVKAQLSRWLYLCEQYGELEVLTGEHREAELREVRRVLSTYEDAHYLAEDERKRLDLGLTPGRDLLEVLEERVGVKVLFLDLDDEFSGASVARERFGPAILVNRAHSAGRRAFTLAHEYFHLLTRGRIARSRVYQAAHLCEAQPPGAKKDRAEQLADQFAGRLLFPPEHFIERLRAIRREDGTIERLDLIGVARYFGVSVQAVFVELARLKLVPWDLANAAYRDPELRDRMLEEGPDRGPEPVRFKRLAVKAFVGESISRARLAELLDVNVADVDEELRRFGAGGAGERVKVALPR